MMKMLRLKRPMSRFAKGERGSASIEALIWVPIFVFFLVMVLDASLLFYGRALALRAVQDGNRALSVGTVTSAAATQTHVKGLLSDIAPSARLTRTIDTGRGIVTTTAIVPATDLLTVGTFDYFDNVELTIRAQHYLE